MSPIRPPPLEAKRARPFDITAISVGILLDIPFALRGGMREEEVVGADKDETAATAAAGEASPALAPTAVPPADHRQLCSSATGIISFHLI